MTDPGDAHASQSRETQRGHGSAAAKTGRQPSLVPGLTLLGLAGVLIVVVLVNPAMPGWLRVTIAVLAVVVVIALLVFAVRLFRDTARRSRAE